MAQIRVDTTKILSKSPSSKRGELTTVEMEIVITHLEKRSAQPAQKARICGKLNTIKEVE